MAEVIISGAGTDDFKPWEDVINHPIVHIYRSPVTPQTFFTIDEELAEKLGLKENNSREFVFVRFPFLKNFPIKGLEGETRRFTVTYGPEWLSYNGQMTEEELNDFFDLENPNSNHKIYAYSKEDYMQKRNNNTVMTSTDKLLYAPFNLNVILCDNGNGYQYLFFYLDFIKKDFTFNGGSPFSAGVNLTSGTPPVSPQIASDINKILIKEYIESSGTVLRKADTNCGKPLPQT